jgi:sulfite reductase (NADPH) flavoprotein alpha-component
VPSQRDFSLIVGFGTDMGNAEGAAMSFTEASGAVGIGTTAIELNQIDLADLQTATHFIVVTSTFGDGEFPAAWTPPPHACVSELVKSHRYVRDVY